MNKKDLKKIIDDHQLWLSGNGGCRADLCGANLRGADLRRADLCRANLCGADLCGANLRGADLRRANLCGADLCGANLCGANLRGANLCGANLCGADLCGANLRGADLRRADLCGADLRGVMGNGRHLKTIYLEKYQVTYTAEYLQIGCQRHTHKDWFDFENERILEMDGRAALKFWRKWKDVIFNLIEMSPAEPTKAEGSEK